MGMGTAWNEEATCFGEIVMGDVHIQAGYLSLRSSCLYDPVGFIQRPARYLLSSR